MAVLDEAARRRLWLYVNWECNLRCDYCVAESAPLSSRPRMALNTFRSLVDEAVQLGFGEVALTGGEPLLHPKISSMLSYSTERLVTILLTNATLISPVHEAMLSRLPRERILVQISLDSAHPDANDRYRGMGSWERAVRGLELLRGWGLRVAVRSTQVNGDAAAFDATREFLLGIGVEPSSVFAAPVVQVGRARQGLSPAEANLGIEPTVAADGLYPHPLRVSRNDRVTDTILPLSVSLGALEGGSAGCQGGNPASGYR